MFSVHCEEIVFANTIGQSVLHTQCLNSRSYALRLGVRGLIRLSNCIRGRLYRFPRLCLLPLRRRRLLLGLRHRAQLCGSDRLFRLHRRGMVYPVAFINWGVRQRASGSPPYPHLEEIHLLPTARARHHHQLVQNAVARNRPPS